MFQSDLWKELDASSRKGSRLAKTLSDKGLISRQKTISDGRTTYRLKPANGENSSERSADEISEEDASQLSPREQQAVSLIQESGGIYQSEFWKELDVSSRTGSRIATGLEEKDLIRRDEAAYNGHRSISSSQQRRTSTSPC